MGQARSRRIRVTGSSTLASGLLLASLWAAPASAAPLTVRVVDDDGHAKPGQCGASQVARTSIQDAIDDSGPDDVVQVCPGSYRETIHIAPGREGLVVRAIGTGPAILKRPTGSVAPAIEVENDETHWVGHDIRVPTTGDCSMLDSAVVVRGATGVILEDILISAVGSGDSFADCGYDTGVLVTDGAAARIIRPRLTDWRSDGVRFDGGGRGRVLDGTFRWIHPDTSPITGAAARPAGGPTYRAISAFSGTVLIKGNDIRRAAGALWLESAIVVSGADTDARVSGNTIRRAGFGILFAYEASGTIAQNDVRIGERSGILVYGDATVDIMGNRITGFGEHSIRLENGGSTISDNDFRGSDLKDCRDTSTGDGTKGTDNTWRGNLGDASPRGICRLPG